MGAEGGFYVFGGADYGVAGCGVAFFAEGEEGGVAACDAVVVFLLVSVFFWG